MEEKPTNREEALKNMAVGIAEFSPYKLLHIVLASMPGLTDRDREMIQLGYDLAGKYGPDQVAPAWFYKYSQLPASEKIKAINRP